MNMNRVCICPDQKKAVALEGLVIIDIRWTIATSIDSWRFCIRMYAIEATLSSLSDQPLVTNHLTPRCIRAVVFCPPPRRAHGRLSAAALSPSASVEV
jgi:hypothetical protein